MRRAETCCCVPQRVELIWAFAVVNCFVPVSLVSIPASMFTGSLLVIVGVFFKCYCIYTSCRVCRVYSFGPLLATYFKYVICPL